MAADSEHFSSSDSELRLAVKDEEDAVPTTSANETYDDACKEDETTEVERTNNLNNM